MIDLSGPKPAEVCVLGDIAAAIVAYLKEFLDCADVTQDADFFALGGDSLAAMMLANAIERDFGVELPLKIIFEAQSISEIVTFVADVAAKSLSPSSARSSVTKGSGS
jgi:acyl carrier protein